MDKNNNILEKFYKFIAWLLPILIAIIALCVSTVTSCNIQKENVDLQKELAIQRENFEINLQMQNAIPHLRLAKEGNIYTEMHIFEPGRQLKIVDMGNGVYSSESYMVINNFNFENLGDNIIFFSHVEYGGVAYELKELNLCVKKDEVVNFSSKNKFIYLSFTNKITIVAKSLYGQYFSYECILNSGEKIGDTRYCTVEQIDEPKYYNIDNAIYNSMERHVRDIYLNQDNIIFTG